MFDANVYYCWSCDAHRRATPSDGKVRCPECQHELTPDARLPIHTALAAAADRASTIAWPAPVRPRLAAAG